MAENHLARIVNQRPTFITLPAVEIDISTPQQPNRMRQILPEVRIAPGADINVPDDYVAYLEGELKVVDGKLVTIEDWSEAKPHPTYTMWKDAGYFTVFRTDDPGYAAAMAKPEGTRAPDNLATFDEAQSLVLVTAEDDKTVLRSWLKTEKRPKVQSAITAKLS